MEEGITKILELAVSQGIWAVLYIYLFFRMLKENKEREERYLTTIANFSNVLDKVNENLATNNKRLEYIEEKIGVEK